MPSVTFESHGEALIGTLVLPEGASASSPAPGLVITGAWFTIKEQMPMLYAREMAQRGFACLVFDFRGFGESGGVIRQRETPLQKIEDIEAAAKFLIRQPEVRGVSGLGICASAGYMVGAASRSDTIRKVGLVAPWLHDAAIVAEAYGGQAAVDGLVATGWKAQTDFQATGAQTFIPAASMTDRSALMFGAPYYTEPDRGMIPAWRNEADPAFWEDWLTFDAMQFAPLVIQPLAVVHSAAAAIPQGAKKFLSSVGPHKRELWLDDISQFDFYDQPEPVRRSADFMASHFGSQE